MGSITGIAWTDATFNGWAGCTEVSAGCDNCYARSLAKRMWNVDWGKGALRHLFKGTWTNARAWNRQAHRDGKTKRVFAMSVADWADSEVPPAWRELFWKLVKECDALTWQLLTKRYLTPSLFPADWGDGYPNVHLGVSIENPEHEYRATNLMTIPARVHWISAEPLLANLNWRALARAGIDWFVVGGESDQQNRAREFRVEWALDAIEQCHAAGKRVFVKQKGSHCIGYQFKDPHGANPSEWLPECRVQEFPPES